MPFTDHAVRMRNGETAMLRSTSSAQYICPVCGRLLDFAPYDTATGTPSRDYCPCCETQFGWDDIIPPDAPVGSFARRWRELRENWLRDASRNDESEAQLANLPPQGEPR